MTPQIQATTKAPGTAASAAGPFTAWSNPSNALTDNGSSATVGFSSGGERSNELTLTNFGFTIPTDAIIDGVVVTLDGGQFSAYGSVNVITASTAGTSKDAGTFGTSYGDVDDLWGLTLTPALVNATGFGLTVFAGDVSGGDGSASVDYAEITVYWHYDTTVNPAEVPIRHEYKVYSNQGQFLGLVPKVVSKFGFSQDINAVGSQIGIEVGISADTSSLASSRITTEAGDPILTEDDKYLMTEGQPPVITQGVNNDNFTLFRNGNRVVVYEYNYWYPNGKVMFAGQINRIEAGFGGGGEETIRLTVLSDGIELDNYVARGTPFTYTDSVSQTSQNNYVTVQNAPKGGGINRYGQVYQNASATNLGAIKLRLLGTATVTLDFYDNVNGNFLGSTTQSVNTAGAAAVVQFGFPSLITISASTQYFFTVSVNSGQTIRLYYSSSNPDTVGSMYESIYAGGSGGGSWTPKTGSDLYYVTQSGTATTAATYTSKDPATEMLSPILADYNLRGGRITEGTIEATGLSLTASFNTNTILDALKSVRDMSPSPFYYYVDLGTDELDFKQASTDADYVLIKGRHLDYVNLVLSIENITNQLLFSGGLVGSTNLYKQYQDASSIALYGPRLERKSDNRVTVSATADAIGNSLIDEKSGEENQTIVRVNYRSMDISLLTPGKVIGFSGFGTFIDNILIQIVRREYTAEEVSLTLGILPPRMSPAIERILRGLIAEQTVANPSTPS